MTSGIGNSSGFVAGIPKKFGRHAIAVRALASSRSLRARVLVQLGGDAVAHNLGAPTPQPLGHKALSVCRLKKLHGPVLRARFNADPQLHHIALPGRDVDQKDVHLA